VRARHYSYLTGNWSTVDPLWPDESAYGYVGGFSTRRVDPSGYRPRTDRRCECYECFGTKPMPVPSPYPIGEAVDKICSKIQRCSGDPKCSDNVTKCIKACNYDHPHKMWSCLKKSCGHNSGVTVNCGGTLCGISSGCAFTNPFGGGCNISICTTVKREPCDTLCSGQHWMSRCEYPECASENISLTLTIAHELAHCCGLGPDNFFGIGGNEGVGDCIALCIGDIR
jgi:hypothetical protein